jgi:hypothetical protein
LFKHVNESMKAYLHIEITKKKKQDTKMGIKRWPTMQLLLNITVWNYHME